MEPMESGRRARRLQERDVARQAEALVSDCEAVLSGLYLEHVLSENLSPPCWAWLNAAAHAPAERLGALAMRPPSRQGSTIGRWYDARAFIAGEVLAHVDCPMRLSDLQRLVLQPLELDLIRRREVARWQPNHLVTAALTALQASPTA